MTFKRFISTSALAFAVLGAAACGGSTDSADTTPPTTSAPVVAEATTAPVGTASADNESVGTESAGNATVGISQSRFGPTELTVAVGDTVTFTNNDPFAHTVTAKDDSAFQFDSGRLGQGETFDVVFAEAGTFAYFCQIHPTMRATIVVG